MAFQSAPDCAEIVMNFTAGGKPMANVMNVLFSPSYGQGDLDNLSSTIDTLIDTYYLPYINTTVTYVNTTVRGLTSAVDLISINNTNAGAGTMAGIQLPNNVTMCFRLGTGFTGRSARGRFYSIPPSVSALQTANTFTVTYADAINDFLDAVQAACPGVGCTLVVLSRITGGALRATAVPYTVLTVDYRNVACDSQRGRLVQGH